MKRNRANSMKKFGLPIALFILAAVLYASVTSTPLQSDEYYYFIGAVDIIQNHTYLIHGIPSQYPLGYPLLIAVSFFFFGINIQSAALPSIIFGALTVVLLFTFIKDLLDEKAAVFASLFFMLSHHWTMSISIMSDTPGLFFILLTLFAGTKYARSEKPFFIYLFYSAAGIAFLIRYVSILSFIIFGLYLLLSKRMHLLKKKEIWLGLPIFFIILLPQLIYNQTYFGSPIKTGYSFPASRSPYMPEKLWGLKYFFTSGYGYSSFGLKFLKRFITGFGTPVFPFFLLGIWAWIKHRKREELSLVLPWIAVPFLYFSFYYSHDPRLLIPVLPAVLIASGYSFSKLYDLPFIKKRKAKNIPIASLLIILVIPTALFRYDNIQRKESLFSFRKKAIVWLEKSTEDKSIILSIWNWHDAYSTKKRLTTLPDTHEELEKILSSSSRTYFVIYNDPNPSFTKKMVETKNWLNEKYELVLLKTIEGNMGFSPLTRIMHSILGKIGYYSSREKYDRAIKKVRWEIYSIQNQ